MDTSLYAVDLRITWTLESGAFATAPVERMFTTVDLTRLRNSNTWTQLLSMSGYWRGRIEKLTIHLSPPQGHAGPAKVTIAAVRLLSR